MSSTPTRRGSINKYRDHTSTGCPGFVPESSGKGKHQDATLTGKHI